VGLRVPGGWHLERIAWHPEGNLIAFLDKQETLTNVAAWNIWNGVF
jgi:hypothetical protein